MAGGLFSQQASADQVGANGFENLNFEYVEGAVYTGENFNGYDKTGRDVDGWKDAGSNSGTGLTQNSNAQRSESGSTRAGYNGPSGDGGCYQIGTVALEVNKTITLKWWGRSYTSPRGKHTGRLMLTKEVNPTTPGFSDLELANSTAGLESEVESNADGAWHQHTITYVVQAGDVGKFPAIHFKPGSNYSAFDDVEFIVETTTPVVGLELVQEGNNLTWTLEAEIGVIKYQVVDAATGKVIETVNANGSDLYSVTLPEGVKAELVVVDNHGSQIFFPIDGNIVTTPYELVKGWNLIAITGEHADISKLQTVAIGPLWVWNGSNYEHLTIPIATQGIWIDSSVKKTVHVTAEKSDAKVSLVSGWNMVGPTNNESIPESAMSVFTYDDTYNAISKEDNLLIRGVGYWIFSL